MSKSKTSTAAATQSSERYDVYVVNTFTGREDKQVNNWCKVGVAFPHKDGPGFNINLSALPTDGKLVMLMHEDKPE